MRISASSISPGVSQRPVCTGEVWMLELREWNYADQEIVLRKGDEMGRFLLGSTVVMLFPAPALVFNPAWNAWHRVKLGELMATHGRSGTFAAPEQTPGAT